MIMEQQKQDMDLKSVIHDQSGFVVDFYKKLWEHEAGNKNAVLSPLSISMALAMAGAGAKGRTLEQISSVLKLPTGPSMHEFSHQLNAVVLVDASGSGGPALSFANGVWVEESLKLKAAYKDAIQKQYAAEAGSADFVNKAEESRKMINSWVLDKTKGKIEDLLPPDSVDGQTKLLLANALYFKGAWSKKFDASETKDETFYLSNGQTVQVPMMRSQKKQFIRNNGKFKVLKLPYQRGTDLRNFSMYVLLPSEKNGLPELVKSLESAEFLEQSLSHVQEVKVGDFQLPKFKISFGIQVPDTLKQLGLVLPFSNEADFSEIVDSPAVAKDLFISDVFHKAFVEVNEEGTEAAAATAATITLKSISFSPPEDFVADHPFLFLIKEDATGIVLFVGHVNNPAVSS